ALQFTPVLDVILEDFGSIAVGLNDGFQLGHVFVNRAGIFVDGLSQNRLIGIGPQMLDETKVVFIDRNGDYLRDQSMTWGDYMVRMARVQNLMAENFGVKARNNAISGDIAELAAQLGASNSAETD
ncbi:MAG: hypothetical protein AAFW82_03395, partial [Pseudomonadota bacterium]